MLALRKVRQIRSDLRAILAGENSDARTDAVVSVCHALAVACINSKMVAGTLSEEFIGLNSRDIALDCIAELFQRDQNGLFIQLKAYFEGVTYETISDEELLTHFRRLVFSKVNDRLFRIYREVDPSLAKIIHNIKVVVNTLHNFDEIVRLGENCICPSFVDRLDESPVLEIETLEREMRKRVRGTERIPDLMAELSLFLRRQDEFCRVVPIVGVALVFRSVYSEPINEATVEPTAESDLLVRDAEKIIREACREVKSEMKPRYVAKKKVSSKHIDYYFCVIEKSLVGRFTQEEERDESLFEQLKNHISKLNREEYQRSHKRVLEYLLRLSTDRAKKKLAEMYR